MMQILVILKRKIKGGSETFAKQYDGVSGSIFVKGVEELRALQIYYEMQTKS